eukprot:2896397-Amphidinium_carterae.2
MVTLESSLASWTASVDAGCVRIPASLLTFSFSCMLRMSHLLVLLAGWTSEWCIVTDWRWLWNRSCSGGRKGSGCVELSSLVHGELLLLL